MKISRKGAAADHGVKSVTLNKGKTSFDATDGQFLIKYDTPVNDFSYTGSRHRYRVYQELSDYLEMTRSIAQSIKEIDDPQLIGALQSQIPDFLRLATVLSTKG